MAGRVLPRPEPVREGGLTTISDPEPRPGRDHVLIVGPSKTGTTGVYATLKHAFVAAGYDYSTVFEPHRSHTVDNLFVYAPHRPVLAKATLDRAWQVVPDPLVFDRRLTTVRDPRDTLISSLLFRPLTKASLARADDAAVARFVDALRGKEADPSSISVLELFDLAAELGIGGAPIASMVRDLAAQRELIDAYGFRAVRYEDFVAQQFDDLSTYLGVPLGAGTAESSTYGHIARSKESGAFRHWFRDDDLRRLDDVFGTALDVLGYPRDVELPSPQVIDPATSSDYLQARYAGRRAQLENLDLTRADVSAAAPVTSDTELASLVDAATDGSARDALRLAHVYRRGDLGEPDPGAALKWARRSAELGFGPGVEMTIELIQYLGPAHPTLRRELRRWQAWRSPTGEANARAEVARLRESSRLRVGTLLVDAATDPKKQAVPAVRGLLGMWRRRRANRAARSGRA